MMLHAQHFSVGYHSAVPQATNFCRTWQFTSLYFLTTEEELFRNTISHHPLEQADGYAVYLSAKMETVQAMMQLIGRSRSSGAY